MITIRPAFLACLALFGAPSGVQDAPPPLPRRYDFGHRRGRVRLPGRLREISGLAVSPDGRVFAHDDERAVLYEIDPESGDEIKRFALGRRPLRGDFEGLAIADGRFFLVTSTGMLYTFAEEADHQATAYHARDTGLGDRCEIEGLAYDPRTGQLLLACKSVPKRERGFALVYRLPLDDSPPPPPLRVDLSALEAFGLDPQLHPSGIEVDPATGNLVLIASREAVVAEVTREGHVRSAIHLPRHRHPQMEGVAFLPDGTLLISDEGGEADARLTRYGPPVGQEPGR